MPYSTEDVPFNATPMSGRIARATGSGAATIARMQSVVAASGEHDGADDTEPLGDETADELPDRAAREDERAAPCRRRRPTSPFAISAKGRNVRKPVRVALSIMPMAVRAPKPRVSRMPQPAIADAAGRSPLSGTSGVRRAQHAQDAERRRATPITPYAIDAVRQPMNVAARATAARHHDLADVAGEVVGSERGAPRARLVRPGDERRRERVLDAGADPGHQQDAQERRESAHPFRPR